MFKIQKMKNGGKPHSYIFKWYFFGYLFIFTVVAYLENWFLNKAELATYSNGFINNYLYPIIYPEGLTNNIQIYLGITLIVINILIYGFIFKNFKRF